MHVSTSDNMSCRFAGKVSTWYLMPFRKIQLFNWCCVIPAGERNPANCLNFYAVSSKGSEHCDEDIYLCEYVFVCFCVSVCVSACEHISGSNHFCARYPHPRISPPLLALRYIMYRWFLITTSCLFVVAMNEIVKWHILRVIQQGQQADFKPRRVIKVTHQGQHKTGLEFDICHYRPLRC